MSATTVCPGCGARYRGVPSAAAGSTYPCRRCGRAFTVVLVAADEPPATVADEGAVAAAAPPTLAAAGAEGADDRATPAPPTLPEAADDGPPPTRAEAEDGGSAPATAVDHGGSRLPTSGVAPPVTAPDRVEPPPPARPPGADTWAPGELILGLYEVVSVLGRGGMGAVYRVRHRGWNVDLAVKSPLAKVLSMTGGAEAFVREAETWVNLGLHPHVVSAFYVRTVDGVPRVFAEFVDGPSLQQLVRGGRLTDLATVLDIAIQLAWGLHYSHECGVIHQDVKPGNVLVDAGGVAKITDFGLARAGAAAGRGPVAAGDATTSVLVTAGGMTPAYCSPEQQQGEQLSRRSDLWSWAVTLLEVLVGRVTWRSGVAAPAVLEDYLKSVPPEQRRVPVPAALVALLRRCFRPSPGERPATLALVADELVALYPELTGHDYRRQRPTAGRDTADSLNNRAVSLLDLGREEEAVELWRQALARRAHHVEATYNAAVHAWKRGAMSDQEVLRTMQELRSTETTSSRDEHLLGKIHLALADYDQALALLADAGDDGADAELVRDRSLAQTGVATRTGTVEQWQAARTSLETAVDLGRTDPHIVTAYAAALARSGERERAERIYLEACARLRELPAVLDQGLESYVPRSEVVREWQPCSDAIRGVALTASGVRLVAIGDGHRLTVWDAATGDGLAAVNDAKRQATAIAVVGDGQTAIVACEREPLQVWDLARGQRDHALQPHQGSVGCLAVTADGRGVVAGSSDRRVRVWGLAERSLRLQLEGHQGAVTAVATAPGWVVSGSLDGTVRAWSLDDGSCRWVGTGHGAPLRAVALAAASGLVLSGGDDGVVRLWSLERGEVVRAFRGHGRPVTAVAFVAHEQRALSASADGTVRLWELASGLPTVVTRFTAPVTALVVGGDGRLAAAVVGGRSLALLRPFLRRPYQLPYAVCVPVSAVEAVERAGAFDARLDEARRALRERRFDLALAALVRAREVPGFERAAEALRLWRRVAQRFPRAALQTGWEERSEQLGDGPVTALAVAPDGTRVALGLGNGRVLVADLAGAFQPVGLGAHDQLVASLAWLGDSGDVVSASWDGTLIRWSSAEATPPVVLSGHQGYVHEVAALPDGERCLSVGDDGSVRLWRVADPATCQTLETTSAAVHAAAVSGDGGLAVAGSRDHALVLWDLAEASALAVLSGHRATPTAACFVPDGSAVLAAAGDRSLILWDLASGRALRRFSGLASEALAVAVSPDGAFAASGHRGGEIQLWELRRPQAVRTFAGHAGAVSALSFVGDGARLLSAGVDGTVRWWYLDWLPELRDDADWSERARPFVELALIRAAARAARTSEAVRLSADDRRALLAELAERGLGWLRPDGVEAKLQEAAASFTGATSTTRAIRAAERPRLPRAWRGRRARRAWPPAALAAAALVTVAVAAAAVALLSRGAGYNEARCLEARAAVLARRSPEYQTDLVRHCQESDRGLYLDWALDPREADAAAVTCLATVADARALTALVDRLRVLDARAREAPSGLLALPPRQFVVVEGEETSFTNAGELTRLGRLVATVLAVGSDELAASAHYLLGDASDEVRAAVATGLAARGDRASVAAVAALADEGSPGARRAAARALLALVASGRLSARRAQAVTAALAAAPEPDVRQAAAEALPLFDP